MFRLTESHLRVLCELNCFEYPKSKMVFFGLRGCLPLDENNHTFANEHSMELITPNHENPRCTIIQWRPKQKDFATFPASTVPHKKYIGKSLARQGVGANQLMTGFYPDYRKGTHKPGSSTGHEAFRQTKGRPIRRTADDYDYQNDDRVEFTNPNDNLHAGWCQSTNSVSFASAGCQVMVGYPKCKKYGTRPDIGPWKVFKKNAYDLDQDSFPYVLLNGRDAYRVALLEGHTMTGRLRYGSFGEEVAVIQKALAKKGFYEGKIDKDFGPRTLNAVIEFQVSVFGPDEDDGIVGPNTAAAMNVKLHTVKISSGN